MKPYKEVLQDNLNEANNLYEEREEIWRQLQAVDLNVRAVLSQLLYTLHDRGILDFETIKNDILYF